MMTNRETTKEGLHCGFALRRLFRVAALCVVALGMAASAFASPPTVTTPNGVVIGLKANGMDEFLGIPYALPPLGSLRWTPPQPYGPFPTDPFHATEFGNVCPQAGGGDENCLFLNVFTPASGAIGASTTSSGLPVMVWIHGGGLIEGSSNSYNPQWLVKEGVIVVSLNYRLGYLGFFAQTAIDAEGHTNGNYGLMDQQLALQWVQSNIGYFGGNPAQVTIFGQSAGGQSVYAQLASPLATGLFSGAIAQSGSYAEFQPYLDYVIPLAQGETVGGPVVPSGETIANNVGCTSQTAACLRAVSAATMIAGQPFPLFPFVDGTLLTQTMYSAFGNGQFNQVPVITGTTEDEYRLFVAENYDFQGNPILTSAEYTAAVELLFPSALVPHVLFSYPFTDYPTGGQALGTAGTDGIFSCPGWNAAQLLSAYTPTYAYEFADENAPPAQGDFGGALTFPLGAYHTSELQYLFKQWDAFGFPPSLITLTPQQTGLSQTMRLYWTQFAKTGNPNIAPKPVWPAYSTSTDLILSLVEPKPFAISYFGTEHLCTLLWNEIP